MLRKIRLPQPEKRKSRHAIFPKNFGDSFRRPLVSSRELPERRKWTESLDDLTKRVARPRFSGKKRNAIFRRTRIDRSEEHTSELQSLTNLVCRLLLEK